MSIVQYTKSVASRGHGWANGNGSRIHYQTAHSARLLHERTRHVVWIVKRVALALLVLCLCLSGGLLAVGLIRPTDAYSVSVVQAGLRQDTRAWIGRTIDVQGQLIIGVMDCQTPRCSLPAWTQNPHCRPRCTSATWEELWPSRAFRPGTPLILRLAGRPFPSPSLDVVYLLRNWLSDLPAVGPYFPRPCRCHTYRIRLLPQPSCSSPPPGRGRRLPCAPQGMRV